MHVIFIRNTYKADILFLLISNLVTQNYLQHSIDITTEQTFRHMEPTDAKL